MGKSVQMDIVELFKSFHGRDLDDVTILGIHKLEHETLVEIEHELDVVYIHVSLDISPINFYGNIAPARSMVHLYIRRHLDQIDVDEILEEFPNVDTLELACNEPNNIFFHLRDPQVYKNVTHLCCGVTTYRMAKVINLMPSLKNMRTNTMEGDFIFNHIDTIAVREEVEDATKYFDDTSRVVRYMKDGSYSHIYQPASLQWLTNTAIDANSIDRSPLPKSLR